MKPSLTPSPGERFHIRFETTSRISKIPRKTTPSFVHPKRARPPSRKPNSRKETPSTGMRSTSAALRKIVPTIQALSFPKFSPTRRETNRNKSSLKSKIKARNQSISPAGRFTMRPKRESMFSPKEARSTQILSSSLPEQHLFSHSIIPTKP